jgi:hypothetical protein
LSIRSIKTVYKGVEMMSTLEADWAKTFDSWSLKWAYEPEGVKLANGENYRPDFWLPSLSTWVEVKGTGIPRRYKTALLAQASLHAPGCGTKHLVLDRVGPAGRCECGFGEKFPFRLAIVARPPMSGKATWEAGDLRMGQRIVLLQCPVCGQRGWADANGPGFCRRCWHKASGGRAWSTGTLPFLRNEPPRGRRGRPRS